MPSTGRESEASEKMIATCAAGEEKALSHAAKGESHRLEYFRASLVALPRPWVGTWILATVLLSVLHALATFVLGCFVVWGSDVPLGDRAVPAPIILLERVMLFPGSLIVGEEVELVPMLLNSVFNAGTIAAAYLLWRRKRDSHAHRLNWS
jgi:hypothetical protein